MAKLDVGVVPVVPGSDYPAPFSQAVDARLRQRLGDAGGLTDDDPEVPAVMAILSCRVGKLTAYGHYLDDLSPFATQQGLKGAEFERLLVPINDEEGQGQRQFSYEKYLGMAALSVTDDENIARELDNIVDRTRRLFCVCCSRATRDHAVVMFVHHIAVARTSVEAAGRFAPEEIVAEAALEAALA